MFNPFEQKPMALKDTIMDWKTVYPKPYSKHDADPYTKLRIILMNGIEVEGAIFSHQFHRHCNNNDLRRELALMRRVEQQQQKHINWLKPIDETQIETTIGYEHVAVDLTAWLAQNEPDPYVKQALDFALLEDFDHLYRYANLLDYDYNIPAHQLVKAYVDITPGRPTIAEHRYPMDDVKHFVDFKTADIQTKLNTMIITAGEQQTMNFYMNLGNTYSNDLGRQLYLEIAMIEEQHVSHYGSLIDPNSTWLESLLLHEYMECYLYYSFYMDEMCPNTKSIWEMHLQQELAHLHKAAELLAKYEKKSWEQVVPGNFPKLLQFHDTRDYVRKVLAEQIELTANLEGYQNVHEIPMEHDFFFYQNKVNHDVNAVASHVVIEKHQQAKGQDYRGEAQPNPVPELADRKQDNTIIARTK
jgi:rubrerythrin